MEKVRDSSGLCSGQVWCYRKLIMAAKISNLSRRHFFGEVQYLRYRPCVFNHDYEGGKKTTPLSWPPSTLSCLTGSYYRASYSWRGKADNGGFLCGHRPTLSCLRRAENWWGHIKTIRTQSTRPGSCYPQCPAVLLPVYECLVGLLA